MKRLLKHATGIINLYHGTNSQLLMNIHADEFMLPADQTGQRSNGFQHGISLVQDGIYLGQLNEVERYANNSVDRNTQDHSSPVIAVILKLELPTENLGPDYDELITSTTALDRDNNDPLWKQSLDAIGSCVHYGPIPIENIKGVKLLNKFKSGYNEITDEHIDKVFADKQEDEWLDFKKAISLIEKLTGKKEEKKPEKEQPKPNVILDRRMTKEEIM